MAEVIVILAFFYLIYKLFTVKGYSKEQDRNILVKGIRPICHSLINDIQKEYDTFKNSPESFEYPTFESYLIAKHDETDRDFNEVLSKLGKDNSTK